MRWISQRGSGYPDCFPIAVCNALRSLGISTPRPCTRRWEGVVDVAGCRDGGTISEHAVARFLGAKLKRIRRVERGLPAIVMCDNPEVGSSSHAVAVVDVGGSGKWKVINYRTQGPAVEWLVPRATIAAPQALPYRLAGYGLLVPLDREAFGDRIYLQEPWYKVVPR